MSASSSSSPATRPDRAAARLAVLTPGGRTRVFEGVPGEVSGLDAFAVIAAGDPATPAGFVPVAVKAHRQAVTLGKVVHEQWSGFPLPAGWKSAGATFCRTTGIASVVGDRITYVTVPGCREYYYVRSGLAVPADGWRARVMDLLMTSGGLGHLPIIGATAASAAVCLAALAFGALAPASWWTPAMFALAFLATAVCAAGEKWAQRHYVAPDPREVVLDEVAGMAAALVLTGPAPWAVVATFFAFRFFDIFKVGVHWIERRNLPGGIVWDDVLAGLYAGALVSAADRWWTG
jgi:phosphatidylglycerophosphatase A